MSDLVRFDAPVRSSTASSSHRSDQGDFVPVALFSRIGLLASLMAELFGMQSVWI